jgi:signal transduction histidine kinase
MILSQSLISFIKSYYTDQKKAEMYRLANTIAINLKITGFFEDSTNVVYLNSIKAIVDGRAMIVDNTGTVRYDSNDIEFGKLYASDEIIKGLAGKSNYTYLSDVNSGRVSVPINDSKNNKVLGVIIITSSFEEITDAISSLQGIVILVMVILIILIVLLSFYFSVILTKPFKQFISVINKVTDGYIDEKINIKGNYEIEKIGTAFNHMIDKLAEIEDARQQFVANVSHELKTPLSSVKVLAQALLTQEDVPKELYKEFMTDINMEIDRETEIINDLLTLVTLDKKDNELNIEEVNVNELVEKVMKILKPLAGQKNIEMVFESHRQVVAEIDEPKISRVITNVVENAIKYNKEFGFVNVTLNADHRNFFLNIKDTGIGIPSESIDKVFKRFYRIDKTRSRDTGGTGLGLSIVQKTIIMHHGTVKCESELDKGTTFIIKIPLKHIS